MRDFKLLYDTLLAEQTRAWTPDELATFARIIERDGCLSETERITLLEHVAHKQQERDAPLPTAHNRG